MRQQRIRAAQEVASHLIPLEKGINDALLLKSDLTSAIIRGLRDTRAELPTAQAALRRIEQAGALIAEARAYINDAHMELRDVTIAWGLGRVDYGDYGETGAAPPSYEPEPLRVVA